MNSLIYLAILLVVIWLVAVIVVKVTGFFLHLLWIAAVVLFVIWLIGKFTR
jgi:hypothetical protein